jgi:hypothetical protein
MPVLGKGRPSVICPNANGSESPTYTEHADSVNLDYRLRVMAHRDARAQYLRILEEIDAGIEVTQPMRADELRARLDEAQGNYICAPLIRRAA